MRIELIRDRQTQQGTTGRLFFDATFVPPDAGLPHVQAVGNDDATHAGKNAAPFCVTLERSAARFGDAHPCIPAGEYRVVLYHSPHFGRLMPLLEGVPDRSGIEIHWGNFVHDFEGCIGVGAWRGQMPDGTPTIWNSRATFDRVFAQIEAALARASVPSDEPETCTIAVRDPQLSAACVAATPAPGPPTEREIDAQGV